MNLFNLQGKTALVTGGNTGIGLGMVKGLATAGADTPVLLALDLRCDAACARHADAATHWRAAVVMAMGAGLAAAQ